MIGVTLSVHLSAFLLLKNHTLVPLPVHEPYTAWPADSVSLCLSDANYATAHELSLAYHSSFVFSDRLTLMHSTTVSQTETRLGKEGIDFELILNY